MIDKLNNCEAPLFMSKKWQEYGNILNLNNGIQKNKFYHIEINDVHFFVTEIDSYYDFKLIEDRYSFKVDFRYYPEVLDNHLYKSLKYKTYNDGSGDTYILRVSVP